MLQSEVERQRILMKELTEQMDGLRTSTAAERKDRARAALRVSEGIAAEREAIVSELNLMRVINTKMVDERDAGAGGAPPTTQHLQQGGRRGDGACMASEGKFVSLQEAGGGGGGGLEQQPSLQLSSLNPLAMRNAELPGQNLERMRRLGGTAAVNGNGVDHSDVECDDDYYDDKCFPGPTPAARGAIQTDVEARLKILHGGPGGHAVEFC